MNLYKILNDRFIIRYKNNFTLMDQAGNLNLEVLDNVIDFKNKKLTNIKNPENDLDCTNKKYVDNIKPKRFVYNQKIFGEQRKNIQGIHKDWYLILANVKLNENHKTVIISRFNANNKVYKITSKGDGHLSSNTYIYEYYSHITISNIQNTSFEILFNWVSIYNKNTKSTIWPKNNSFCIESIEVI